MNKPTRSPAFEAPVDWRALDNAAGPPQAPTRQSTTAERHARSRDETACQRRLVEALYARLHGENDAVRLIETHISFVLLTGRYAYKIKKAIKLAFLDFSTLTARRVFCEDELRLNRRLAPRLYLDVVPISGTFEAPTIGGTGPILEYAVRMRQFPQDTLLSDVIERNELTTAHVDSLAQQVARFHSAAPVASSGSPFGTPGGILELALDNFVEIETLTSEHRTAGTSMHCERGPGASMRRFDSRWKTDVAAERSANATAIFTSATSRSSTANRRSSTVSSSARRCAGSTRCRRSHLP